MNSGKMTEEDLNECRLDQLDAIAKAREQQEQFVHDNWQSMKGYLEERAEHA